MWLRHLINHLKAKSGKNTWGKDYFWNGCASKAEKGLELVLCAIIDVGKNTAYALAAEQTPATDRPKGKKTTKKIDDFTRMDIYLGYIKKLLSQDFDIHKIFCF